MAGIERCEARIRYIRNSNKPSPLGANIDERVATTPDAHFHIGKSQNSPENIMMFLHNHSEDPAVKVSRTVLIATIHGSPSTSNRIFSQSSNFFYFLKSKIFFFVKTNSTPPERLSLGFLLEDRSTLQVIGFIGTI